MIRVPRQVRILRKARERVPTETAPMPLHELHGHHAYVLLGEPGAGKTSAFEEEAAAVGGLRVDIARFIETDDPAPWTGKTLFLDGLDEIRATTAGPTVLHRVRERLRALRSPAARIACRAADWLGTSDLEDLAMSGPSSEWVVAQLEPLTPVQILEILRANHGIEDADGFVAQAEQLGLSPLLGNPQTLRLLAEVVRAGEWPSTRAKTFDLACRQLAVERNKRHHDRHRGSPLIPERILDAAGQLFAVLLLSDKDGITLGPAETDPRFPALDPLGPADAKAAAAALGSRLFRPEGEERMVPSHRTIAEFLSARWLTKQIDQKGLPITRVLQLIGDSGGRTIAGLRGLFAWLALYSIRSRERLIRADPVTTVVYGDASPMPPEAKRQILAALREEASRHTAFCHQGAPSQTLGALADPELAEDFRAALNAPDRDAHTQAFADCVLEILAEGTAIPQLAEAVQQVIWDSDRWSGVRKTALRTWLKMVPESEAALQLLPRIAGGQISDPEDELLGELLTRLYPEALDARVLLEHLHTPKSPNLIGRYVWFWIHELPVRITREDLPVFLDGLASPAIRDRGDLRNSHLYQMGMALLRKGLEEFGDAVADERLFVWLGIGRDEFGHHHSHSDEHLPIQRWLEQHPDRYKAVLKLCFRKCAEHKHPRYCVDVCSGRLHDAAVPADMGIWHLDLVAHTANEELAQQHLQEAVATLYRGRGDRGLSIEGIEHWATAHPALAHWLDPLLCWEIPEWRAEQAQRSRRHSLERAQLRRQQTRDLASWLPKVRAGNADPGVLHHLASIWEGHYYEAHGDNPAQRFEACCENPVAIRNAAETGFRKSLEREDLPTVQEIVELARRRREHLLQLPCLIGMRLRWQDNPESVRSLPTEVLRRAVTFCMARGSDGGPGWYRHLVVERPDLVADILVPYAGSLLRARHDHVHEIHLLDTDPEFRSVAQASVPALLERFPPRARAGQLQHLRHLLWAALRNCPDEIRPLVETKLALSSLTVGQRVFWLTASVLLEPVRFEPILWDYVATVPERIRHVADFLRADVTDIPPDVRLSANTIRQLIELLAPHAEVEWPTGGGPVTEAMRHGNQIRALIQRLVLLASDDAAQAVDHLLGNPVLAKLRFRLESAREELQIRQREQRFRFRSPEQVARILANKKPEDPPDLTALVLDHLDDIQTEIRSENDDGFRRYWNLAMKPPRPLKENHCRDVLLYSLRTRLDPFGIDCQPEADYSNDKRADIRVSVDNRIELPIEIKRDSNPEVEAGLRSQLIARYTHAPKADGHGIYLVFWFGTIPDDRKRRPRFDCPKALQTSLESLLQPAERGRIAVRVVDVSLPS